MAFASLTIDLNARLANIERDMGRAAQVAERNSQRMQAAFTKASSAAAGIAAALGVGSFTAFIKGSIDAADNLNDLSKKTGLAVEDLAGLQLVVDKSGTSMEMLGNGIGKLNKYMGEAAQGNQEAQRTLKALGITASDPMEAFLQLADAFGKFRTEGDRAAVMSRVIGKTWGELAPALAEGSAGLREMIEDGKRLNPITKEMAEQADKFNDAMSRFKTEAAGVGTSIATTLLPSLNKLLEQMNEGIRVFGSFGSALYNIGIGINPFASLTEGLAKYRKEIADLERFKASANNPDESFTRDVDARIEAARKKLEFLKAMQRQEALALNDKFGTANYKQAAQAKKLLESSAFGTPGKSTSAKLDTIMTERDRQLRAAQLAEIKAIAQAQADAFEIAMDANDAQIDSETRALISLQAMKEEYIGLIDPVEQYRRKLEEIDQLQDAGYLTAEQATQARFVIQQQIENLNELKDANKEAVDFIQSVWDAAAKNMQDALANFLFDPFQDGLKGMLIGFVDTLRRMASEALAANIMQSIFGTGGSGQNALGSLASLFGFASGGIMTSAGPLALNSYAGGGIANSPQLALFGEGRRPEAYVPLPDGRSIPVTMRAQAPAAQNIRIVNAFDTGVVGDYLGSASGERIIMNTVRRNAGVIRSVLA